METAEATPSTAVRAHDLADAVAGPGPFLSLYLTVDRAVESPAQRNETRWKSVRRELEDQGVPDSVLDEIEAAVPSAHDEGEGLAVIAAADEVRHLAHLAVPPAQDVAGWGDLPAVLPLLRERQSSPAFVLVVADRNGADLTAHRYGSDDVETEAGGQDFPISKVKAGGWSQRRFQQRAENTWEQNAADVAEQVSRLVEQVDARLVILAGDDRARALIEDDLPADLGAAVHHVTGGRSEDGSDEHVDAQVRELVAELVATETAQLMELFRQEAGQHDRAAEGPARTLEALARAQVDTVLVSDTLDEGTAWYGEEPTQVGSTADEVRAFGADEPREGRLVDVVVRAALGTGAAVRVLDRDGDQPEGGIAAILRWGQDNPAAPTS